MLTGSAIEVIALMVAPPIAVISLALSAGLRESVVARRVLAGIALLALLEIVLFWMVFSTVSAPGA